MPHTYALHVVDDLAYLVITDETGEYEGLVLRGDKIIGDITPRSGGGEHKLIDLSFLPNKHGYMDISFPRTIRDEITDLKEFLEDKNADKDEVSRWEAALRGIAEYQQKIHAPVQDMFPPTPGKGIPPSASQERE